MNKNEQANKLKKYCREWKLNNGQLYDLLHLFFNEKDMGEVEDADLRYLYRY